MYVMTIDQRGSTTDVDRVPGLLAELAALSTAGRFERSVGDEVQGVVERPGEVVEIALHALRSGRWYVGIGVGRVDLPLPASPREGSGPAFVAARLAVEKAKSAAAHVPLAVVSGGLRRGEAAPSADGSAGARACANAEAVLRLIGRLVQDRTAAQWKVVDVLRSVQSGQSGTSGTHGTSGQSGTHGSQKIAANNLGITEQSVSRALLRSGWQEEWAARPAAETLLTLAHGLIAGADTSAPEETSARDSRTKDTSARDTSARDTSARENSTEGDR